MSLSVDLYIQAAQHLAKTKLLYLVHHCARNDPNICYGKEV